MYLDIARVSALDKQFVRLASKQLVLSGFGSCLLNSRGRLLQPIVDAVLKNCSLLLDGKLEEIVVRPCMQTMQGNRPPRQ